MKKSKPEKNSSYNETGTNYWINSSMVKISVLWKSWVPQAKERRETELVKWWGDFSDNQVSIDIQEITVIVVLKNTLSELDIKLTGH